MTSRIKSAYTNGMIDKDGYELSFCNMADIMFSL